MKSRRVTRYMIRASPNVGSGRMTIGKEFKTKQSAQSHVNKITSPGKVRSFKGQKVHLTSYRDAQSGTGLKNPRIIKRKVFR